MARKKLLLKRSAFRYYPEKYKIKRKVTFFSVNTKNISSHVLKISSISLKMPVFSTNSMKYIWYSHDINIYNAITPNNCFVKESHKYYVYLVEENKHISTDQ